MDIHPQDRRLSSLELPEGDVTPTAASRRSSMLEFPDVDGDTRRHSALELPNLSAMPAPSVDSILDAAATLGPSSDPAETRLLARQAAAKHHAAELLGRAPINKTIFTMIWPNFITLLATAVQGFVVTVFIGMFSKNTDVTTGNLVLSTAAPLVKMLLGCSMTVGNGASSLYARRLGTLDTEGASEIIAQSHLATLLLDVFMAVVLVPMGGLFASAGGAPSNGANLSAATAYCRLMIAFHIMDNHALLYNNLARAQGSVVSSALIIIVSVLISIACDPLFLSTLTPGINSSTAVSFSRLVGFAINAGVAWIVFSRCKQFAVATNKQHFRPIRWSAIGKIFALGMPVFISQFAAAATLIGSNWVAIKLSGPPAGTGTRVYALSLVDATLQMGYMPVFSASQAILPIGSYCFGAGLKRRFRSLFMWVIIWCVTMSLIIIVLISSLAPQISKLWVDDPAVGAVLVPLLRVAPWSILSFSISLCCYPLMLCAGRPSLAAVLAVLPTLCDTLFMAVSGAIFRSPIAITSGAVFGSAVTAVVNVVVITCNRRSLFLVRDLPEDPEIVEDQGQGQGQVEEMVEVQLEENSICA